MKKTMLAILNQKNKEQEEEEEEEEAEEEDDEMIDMGNEPGLSSGCTAVVTLLRDRELFVANAGDSRCVVCRNGRAIEMSTGSSLALKIDE